MSQRARLAHVSTHRQKRVLSVARHQRMVVLRRATVDKPWWSLVPAQSRGSAFRKALRATNLAGVAAAASGAEYDAALVAQGELSEWVGGWREASQ